MTRSWLFRVLALAPGVLVGGAIAVSPDPAGPWLFPLGQRLLYVHVALAWASYVGFVGVVVAALLVLSRGSLGAGRWMRALVEPTSVFAVCALGTGLAWSYEFALFDPLRDPKVVSTVVLVGVLVGLWVLSRAAEPSRRDQVVASVSVVGFVSVPASFFASRLATPHPDFTRPGEGIDAFMLVLVVVAMVGFLSLLTALARLRRRQLALEEGSGW